MKFHLIFRFTSILLFLSCSQLSGEELINPDFRISCQNSDNKAEQLLSEYITSAYPFMPYNPKIIRSKIEKIAVVSNKSVQNNGDIMIITANCISTRPFPFGKGMIKYELYFRTIDGRIKIEKFISINSAGNIGSLTQGDLQ